MFDNRSPKDNPDPDKSGKPNRPELDVLDLRLHDSVIDRAPAQLPDQLFSEKLGSTLLAFYKSPTALLAQGSQRSEVLVLDVLLKKEIEKIREAHSLISGPVAFFPDNKQIHIAKGTDTLVLIRPYSLRGRDGCYYLHTENALYSIPFGGYAQNVAIASQKDVSDFQIQHHLDNKSFQSMLLGFAAGMRGDFKTTLSYSYFGNQLEDFVAEFFADQGAFNSKANIYAVDQDFILSNSLGLKLATSFGPVNVKISYNHRFWFTEYQAY